MLLGDLLEKIFIKTGIKWLVKKIVIDLLRFKTCNCEKRKLILNNFHKNFKNDKDNDKQRLRLMDKL